MRTCNTEFIALKSRQNSAISDDFFTCIAPRPCWIPAMFFMLVFMIPFDFHWWNYFTQTYSRTLSVCRCYEEKIVELRIVLFSTLTFTSGSENVHTGTKLTLVVEIQICNFLLDRGRIRLDFTQQLQFSVIFTRFCVYQLRTAMNLKVFCTGWIFFSNFCDKFDFRNWFCQNLGFQSALIRCFRSETIWCF